MGKQRKFTAEEKLKIVREGMRDGTKISEVCRRHDIYSSQYYGLEGEGYPRCKGRAQAEKERKIQEAETKGREAKPAQGDRGRSQS